MWQHLVCGQTGTPKTCIAIALRVVVVGAVVVAAVVVAVVVADAAVIVGVTSHGLIVALYTSNGFSHHRLLLPISSFE